MIKIKSRRRQASIGNTQDVLADLRAQARAADHDEQELSFLADPSHVRDFVRFLTIFGGKGVGLRELVMLASIRYLTEPETPFETGFLF